MDDLAMHRAEMKNQVIRSGGYRRMQSWHHNHGWRILTHSEQTGALCRARNRRVGRSCRSLNQGTGDNAVGSRGSPVIGDILQRS